MSPTPPPKPPKANIKRSSKLPKSLSTIPHLLPFVSSPVTVELKTGTSYTGVLYSVAKNFNIVLSLPCSSEKEGGSNEGFLHIRGTLIRYIHTESSFVQQINLGLERKRVEEGRRRRNVFKKK
mmetsp:Transcript_930/g.1657  ORF Transcript_930/g.1657 Transcript_930/m.1657 type:complete len:123 (+) Transcript_930:1-369(+)